MSVHALRGGIPLCLVLVLSLFAIACEGTSGSIRIGATTNSNDNNTLPGDNNTLVGSNNTLIGGNNTLVGSNNTLVGSNNTLPTDNNTMDSDNDNKVDSEDHCPTGRVNWQSNSTTDKDNDGCRDRDEDRDDDGDGLVDILNATELSMITAGLTVEGCGDGRTITSCHGYELMANISLSAHTGGWQPIGKDHCQRQYQPMQLLFEGNGFSISDMVIVQSSEDCLGLFGNIGGEVRNLNLQRMTISGNDAVGILAGQSYNLTIADVSVVSSSLTGSNLVGGLIGDGSNITIRSSQVNINISNSGELIGGLMGESHNTTIINTSVVAGRIDGIGKIGGIIGEGYQITMINASITTGIIRGGNQVGGMLGHGERITIIQSSAITNSIVGTQSSIGGLAGSMGDSMVRGTHVIANNITGIGDVGGLLGITGNTEIVSSLVFVNSINGTGSYIGGLIGQVGGGVDIIASYVVAHSIVGLGSNVGGLVGGEQPINIASSYAIANTIRGTNRFGGLLGYAARPTITSSYVLAEVAQGGGLVGGGLQITINNTYWHNISSLRAVIARPTDILHINPNHNLSLAELSNPTQYDMTIYDGWDNTGTGTDNRHIWCDSNFDGQIDSSEMVDNNRIWDFGTNTNYPAIRCTPDTIAEQRQRWQIDQGKPSLNRMLLDQLLFF